MKRKQWNKFKDFLDKEGALLKWWDNTTDHMNFIKRTPAENFINSAFIWGDVFYWSELNNKWLKHLENDN